MTSRRELVAGLGALSAALAGCSSPGDPRPAEEATATRTPPATPGRTPEGTDAGRDEDEVDADAAPADRQLPADWTPPAGVWSDRTYGPANTAYNPHATPPTAEPDLAWGVSVADGATAVVGDGVVYLRDADGLAARDAAGGRRLWSVERGQGEVLGYLAGRVYDRVDGAVAAYDARGRREWELSYEGVFDGLLEREGRVYLATSEGVQVHHADTGERIGSLRRVGGPATRDGVVYAVHESDLVAFDVTREGLEERWRSPGGAAAQQFGGVAVGPDAAYLLEVDGSDRRRDLLARVDREDGTRTAAHHLDTVVRAPAVAGEVAYVVHGRETDDGGIERGSIVALGPDGESWSRRARDAFGSVLATDDAVLVGAVEGGSEPLRAFDPGSGRPLWRFGDRGRPVAAVGGTVYAVADGRFVALRA